jgi:hypothetical protein
MNFKTKFLGRAYYFVDKVPAKIELTAYYIMQITCNNCGTVDKVYFRKSRYIKDITPAIRCRNCNCFLKNCSCTTCS